ncbi:hypothetical protein M9H77_30370 [Catharanthus roseus]|uniref:Uncharacterized protein n=1 Tax=Catharanthus roseus TaxID=4058 RepID=A0ACC0A1B3_CATRO|nr:hypothetical protein M9H77_30370 [Catharanthus roseus]
MVPCKICAKRGCATHPRSIAERMIAQRSETLICLLDVDYSTGCLILFSGSGNGFSGQSTFGSFCSCLQCVGLLFLCISYQEIPALLAACVSRAVPCFYLLLFVLVLCFSTEFGSWQRKGQKKDELNNPLSMKACQDFVILVRLLDILVRCVKIQLMQTFHMSNENGSLIRAVNQAQNWQEKSVDKQHQLYGISAAPAQPSAVGTMKQSAAAGTMIKANAQAGNGKDSPGGG